MSLISKFQGYNNHIKLNQQILSVLKALRCVIVGRRQNGLFLVTIRYSALSSFACYAPGTEFNFASYMHNSAPDENISSLQKMESAPDAKILDTSLVVMSLNSHICKMLGL